MACAHSQDEANAHNFEGDKSLKKGPQNDGANIGTLAAILLKCSLLTGRKFSRVSVNGFDGSNIATSSMAVDLVGSGGDIKR